MNTGSSSIEKNISSPVFHLEYPPLTMFQMVERMAQMYPDDYAYDFYGRKTSYRTFLQQILQAARAFTALGIRRDDTVTICMPNTPQALVCFYALNRIGAVSNMVHPLSAEKEITFYLNLSGSRMILTMDMFYENVLAAVRKADQPVTILTARMQNELPPHLAAGYLVKRGRPYMKYPLSDRQDMTWTRFLRYGRQTIELPPCVYDTQHTSVILYSGGTSGTPKGICLSDLNFNACALQAVDAIQIPFGHGMTMLSCMPMFHGFGLGINIHLILIHGACCILMPSFSTKSYADMLIKKQPNLIAGVPTIFEALLHMPELDGKDLSCLHGMFCGGDSLSVELKKKIDTFLTEHHASIQVREGYGLTECVTASCLTPKDTYRENSIGLPFRDTTFAIVVPGTDEELPRMTEGEIILKGPTLMLGYLNNKEETDQTLRRLHDGAIWLYTGDLGYMDQDGFVYFRQRIKRMIVTNGYNVYPGQLENVIDSLPEVAYSCVIGVKDPRRMQRVRAYVVLRDPSADQEDVRQKIMKELTSHIAGYALPREILFRDMLPKTLVGKVAFRQLEEEANAEEALKKTGSAAVQAGADNGKGKKKK